LKGKKIAQALARRRGSNVNESRTKVVQKGSVLDKGSKNECVVEQKRSSKKSYINQKKRSLSKMLA